MPISSAIQNGLSTAANSLATPVNSPNLTAGDLNSSFMTDPNQVITDARAGEELVQARVPVDTPAYYTLIKINHYSRSGWLEVGKLELESGVVFPFPQMMIDNQNMSYEIQPLGFAAGMGYDAIASTLNKGISIQNIINSAFSGPSAAQTAGVAAGGVADIVGRIGASVGGPFADAVLSAAGLSVNDFMTVMFRGPNYKQRDFQWKFVPRDAQESEQLRRAILILETAAAASLAGFTGSAFFGWPRIFQLEFRHVDPTVDMGQRTFRMKPAVVRDLSINYTPAGHWSGKAGTHMPEGVEIRLSLLELEYWLNSTRRSRDAYTRTESLSGMPTVPLPSGNTGTGGQGGSTIPGNEVP